VRQAERCENRPSRSFADTSSVESSSDVRRSYAKWSHRVGDAIGLAGLHVLAQHEQSVHCS
jgi:hypothetical protein